MEGAGTEVYSTLEVDQSGLEVAEQPEHNISSRVHQEKQAVPAEGPEAAVVEGLEAVEPQSAASEERHSKRKWLAFGVIASLLVLIAVIVGAVVGSKKHTGNSGEVASVTSSLSESPTLTTTSTSSAASSNETPAVRNIAAVPWSEGNGTESFRVYYQASSGEIMESINNTSNGWDYHGLGFWGKNGSAIAAALSQPNYPLQQSTAFEVPALQPNYPLQINVFYIDTSNVVQEIIYVNNSWVSGTIGKSNYIASANSSLAAMIQQCPLGCTNVTIIAFQDQNQIIQIANSTTTGWMTEQLNASAQSGTALALQPYYNQSNSNQVDLYYQQEADLVLTRASWKPNSTNNDDYHWSVAEQMYYAIPAVAPIAIYSTYSNVSAGAGLYGFETWIYILWVSGTGIVVNVWTGAWSGTKFTWYGNGSSVPAVMAGGSSNGKNYSSIAITGNNVFAAFSIEGQTGSIATFQGAELDQDWSETSPVQIGKA